MRRPLRTGLILSVVMTGIASSAFTPMAWAVDADCPLHKRLTAQNTPQSPVVIEAASLNVAPEELAVISSSVSPMRPAPSIEPFIEPSMEMSPSILQEIEPPERVDIERVGNNVSNQNIQNNFGAASPESPAITTVKPSPHAGFTAILRKYVSAPDTQGLTHFNYGGLKAKSADKAALDSYINELEAINPDDLSANAVIAYYANLYNAVTVQVVTDNYPLKSIRKLGSFNSGPWKKDLFTVNGTPTSLDTVEHKILRKKFPSPYIHYMVNCASVGCPNLTQAAWEADSLERLRLQAARDYINSPRGAVITPKGLKLSSIFKWFKEDFGGNEQGVLEHIRAHAGPDLAQAIDNGAKIIGYDYDWSLNE